MTVASVADLFALLRRLQLLEPEHVKEVARIKDQFPDAKALARELLRRDWITAYQANHLLQGRPKDLVLGHFVLLEKVGEGGMGQIFRARHQSLGRTVAVKIIRPERLTTPGAARRFLREIRVAAQLHHPNFVLAHDAHEHEGTLFLVMEYVDSGLDLARLVKQHGPLPVSLACEYVRQTALGLQYAFERGLVHRDIKPHNLILAGGKQFSMASPQASPQARPPVIKILDMGLALVGHAEEEDSSSMLTREGAVMGTLDYLAPEQATDSHTADIRSDLYSLGCTFYYLLTARVPYPGGDALAKLLRHKMEEPTPIEQMQPDVPPGVAAIIRKLMAKEPKGRFQTPAELLQALASPAAVVAAMASAPVLSPAALPGQSAGVAVATGSSSDGSDVPLGKSNVFADLMAQETANVLNTPRSGTKRGGPGTSPRLLWAVAGGALGLVLLVVLIVTLLRGTGAEPKTGPDNNPSKRKEEPPTHIKETVNSLGMKLMLIPAGKFSMGSPEKEPGRSADEGPQIDVEISHGFYIGAHEVTVGQFREFVKATGYVTEAERNQAGASNLLLQTHDSACNWRTPGFAQTDQHPVTAVSWRDAVAFCRWLSRKENALCRLPTEAEWEYACRARTTTPYHTGDVLKPKEATFGRNRLGTSQVGSYRPNAFGLFDMHGNAWEWCGDWYDAKYYGSSPRLDPHGPEEGREKVIRGGGWDNDAWRSGQRYRVDLQHPSNSLGFRVVQAVERSPAELAQQVREAEIDEAMLKLNSEAAAERDALQARVQDSKEDAVGLRQALLDFRAKYPGTASARDAGDWLVGLPSVLDRLDAAKVPAEVRIPGQPKELVAMIGENRWRHGASLSFVALAVDDQLVVSLGSDRYLRFWDAKSGRELAAYPWCGPVALSPDGHTLAVRREGVIELWELPARKVVARVKDLPSDELSQLEFSPDGAALAAVSSGRNLGNEKYEATLLLWDAKTADKKLARDFAIGVNAAHTFGISRDGKQLVLDFVIERKDNVNTYALKIVNIPSGKEKILHQGPQRYLWPTFSPDGKSLVVNAGGQTLFLDARDGRVRLPFPFGGRPAYSPDGKTIVYSEGKIIDAESKFEKGKFPGDAFGFSKKGDRLIFGGADGVIRFWDLESNQEIDTPKTDPGPGKLVFAPDGKHAVCFTGKTVRLLELDTWHPLHELDGHEEDITAWAFTPDGRQLLTGGKDKMIRRWSLADGKLLKEYKGHIAEIVSVAVSPDGKQVLSAALADELRLWDLETGKVIRTISAGTVRGASFAPDGQHFVTTGTDGVISLWETGRGTELHRFRGHQATLDTAQFLGDARRILSHCATITYVWETFPPMRQLDNFAPHRGLVAVLPDGKTVATIGQNNRPWGALDLWDVDRQVMFKTIPLAGTVTGWSFAPDSRHVALCNGNGTVSILRLETRVPSAEAAQAAWKAVAGRLAQSKANPQELRGEVVAFRGKYPGFPETLAATAHLAKLSSPLDALEAGKVADSARAWWTVAGKKPPANLVGMVGDARRRPGGNSWGVEFSGDGQLLGCVGDYGGCVVWSAQTDALLAWFRVANDPVTLFRFSPDRRHVATGHRSGAVRVWDLTTRKAKSFVVRHEAEVGGLAYSPDGRFLASGGNDGFLKVWDSQSDDIVLSEKQPNWVHVAFTPDGQTLASWGPGWEANKNPSTGLIKFWDVPDWKVKKTMPVPAAEVGDLAFAPNSKLFASFSGADAIKIWSIDSEKEPAAIKLEKEAFTSVAFTHDSMQLITGGAGLRFWSVDGGKQIGRLEAHAGKVRCLAVSRDGALLATGGEDDVLRLWDLKTLKEIRPPSGHTGPVTSVTFSPDDRRLASGGGDKSVRFWDLLSGGEQANYSWHASKVEGLAFSLDGSELFTGSQHIRVLDSETGSLLRFLDGGFNDVVGLWLSADGRRVLGLGNKLPYVWSARTGRHERVLQTPKPKFHGSDVFHIAVSPTGSLAATASGDDTVGLWDFTTGRLVRKFEPKVGPIHRVAFFEDGKRLAAGSHGSAILLWNLDKEDDKPARIIKAHDRSLVGLFVCPGSQRLVTSDGIQIRIWNSATGAKEHEWTLPMPATTFALSSDGRYLAAGNANGTVYSFRLPDAQREARARPIPPPPSTTNPNNLRSARRFSGCGSAAIGSVGGCSISNP